MKVEIYVKEISYGIIVTEVPDGDENAVYDKATDLYGEGMTQWGKLDFQVIDWKKVE
jgi:hypothetical protein